MTKQLAKLLILLPVAGLLYSTFFLPLEVSQAKSSHEYPDYFIGQIMKEVADSIRHEQRSILIDSSVLDIRLVAHNLLAYKYEVRITVHMAQDSILTLPELLLTPAGQFIQTIPQRMANALGNRYPAIIRYPVMFRPGLVWIERQRKFETGSYSIDYHLPTDTLGRSEL